MLRMAKRLASPFLRALEGFIVTRLDGCSEF